jgi:hypothetical protein
MCSSYELHGVRILQCAADGPQLRDERDAVDVIGQAAERGANSTSMPIVIGSGVATAARFGLCLTILFFFMAGFLLHFECLSIGSISHPAGGRPSHPISVASVRYGREVVETSVCALPWPVA